VGIGAFVRDWPILTAYLAPEVLLWHEYSGSRSEFDGGDMANP
jgi:hypothetical protein